MAPNNNNKEIGKVLAVSKSPSHTLIKKSEPEVNLKQGLGVEGDAHFGEKVKHIFDAKRNPNKPNLRQVHLIHSELFQELSKKGLLVNPGEMGENITTSGIDLLNLPLDTVLSIGKRAKIKITGTRKPCNQLNQIQEGLMNAVIGKDAEGNILFLAGVFAVVLRGGIIKVNDKILISLPIKSFQKLKPV